MSFMNWIVNRLNYIGDFFYELYLECYYAGWPLEILDTWFYAICELFYNLAWDFSDFGTWVNDVQAKVSQILSFTNIWTHFQWWFDAAENAWNWVYNATWYIWYEMDGWWTTTQLTVLDWISDIETWTITQLNNLQATLTSLITSLELWTSTQLNNLQATFNALISNVEAWTVTQIDNAKSAILAVIGDLETWTMTEINTIQSILTTLIDWAALTTWITTWWNERLLDIQSLINSAFVIRSDFWQGWQDWRDKVVEFFTDPEDWLYKSVDRIVERFW